MAKSNRKMFITMMDTESLEDNGYFVGSSPEDLANIIGDCDCPDDFDGGPIYEVVKTEYRLKKSQMTVVKGK